jgi:2-dehydropantoate 2-reductase
LKIIADTTEIVAFPSLVSNVPEDSKLDYLICATKTYDIETSLESIKIVLLQTRYSYLYIMVLMPRNEYKSCFWKYCLQGCVYIVAMIESPGIIKNSVYENYFGSKMSPN